MIDCGDPPHRAAVLMSQSFDKLRTNGIEACIILVSKIGVVP